MNFVHGPFIIVSLLFTFPTWRTMEFLPICVISGRKLLCTTTPLVFKKPHPSVLFQKFFPSPKFNICMACHDSLALRNIEFQPSQCLRGFCFPFSVLLAGFPSYIIFTLFEKYPRRRRRRRTIIQLNTSILFRT